jgi:hypothetical protein
MKRTQWLADLEWLADLQAVFGVSGRKRRRSDCGRSGKWRPAASRRATFETLEDRRLLALDYGDAPDTALGTAVGNYNTLSTDNGPNHTIVVGLKLGANVDGDGGALQNATANADDVNGALPDDEDGLTNPAADLVRMPLATAIAKLQQEIADKTVLQIAPLTALAAVENTGGQEF